MLTAILLACRHNISLKTLDSNSSSRGGDGNGGEPIPPAALLQVALSLPSISPVAALSFIQLLHQGVLSGAPGGGGGVHCLSALRRYLQQRASSVNSAATSVATSGLTVASLSKEFSELARACMTCIREEAPSSRCASGLFSSSSGSEGRGSYTASPAALELLPCILELLLDCAEEAAAADILDHLFQKTWPSHLLLTLCNLVCDLIPFLGVRGQYFTTFKVPHCSSSCLLH